MFPLHRDLSHVQDLSLMLQKLWIKEESDRCEVIGNVASQLLRRFPSADSIVLYAQLPDYATCRPPPALLSGLARLRSIRFDYCFKSATIARRFLLDVFRQDALHLESVSFTIQGHEEGHEDEAFGCNDPDIWTIVFGSELRRDFSVRFY